MSNSSKRNRYVYNNILNKKFECKNPVEAIQNIVSY